MTRIPSPAREERAALQLDDLASALDAGLTPEQIGAHAALGDHAIVDLLHRRGVAIDTTETRILTAAWQSGRIAPALKARAERRRQRAANLRVVFAGLRYPLLLLIVSLFSATLTWFLTKAWWLPVSVAAVLVVGALALRSIHAALSSGDSLAARLPVLGSLARQRAELPYLEMLHGLYASGVPLLAAHPQAVAAVAHPGLRAELQSADACLQSNRPLVEALRAAPLLSTETKDLVATGERTGNLEEALERALRRRSDVVARDAATAARWGGAIAYGLVAIFVAWLCLSILSETVGKAYGGGLRR
ncbi:MAG: type II secretion system F family protein [Planctomycetes bacterium]|nr:type II secretion system F family protein [Planctomycetota bacterium]